ncbi:MAG: glycosyltransferase family 2 protein [Clostridia bacterium]|nr:glycosyltransferase family 2 protein [Clostridia bacterium]
MRVNKMQKDYLVTIIIPVYNVEKYIDACLSSAENQTHKNLEIIVIDDCGKDNSIKIVEEHAEKDSRIKIIYQPQNMGQGAGRNRALEITTGDYIVFLDADDTLPLDAVELLLGRILETKSEISIGRMLWNKEHKCFAVEYIDALVNGYLTETGKLRYIEPHKYMLGGPCAKIYDAKWMLNCDIDFAEGCFWEDMVFTLKSWIEAENISVLDAYVYFRTERDDESNPSTTQSYGKKKYVDRDQIFDIFCEYLSKKQQEKIVSAVECRVLINRLMNTTKNIVPMADADIKDWVQEWYKEHLDRCEEKIRSLGWEA